MNNVNMRVAGDNFDMCYISKTIVAVNILTSCAIHDDSCYEMFQW